MLRTTRPLKFLNHIALVALALCSTAALGKSQIAYQGKFTLPVEAHWGGATLPAGEYTITMPDAVSPFTLFLRGEGKVAIIQTISVSDKAVPNDSKLTLTDTAEGEAITKLQAGELGLTFDYAVSKSKAPRATVFTARVIPVRTGSQAQAESAARVNVPMRDLDGPVADR
jgi:hypothetical protein